MARLERVRASPSKEPHLVSDESHLTAVVPRPAATALILRDRPHGLEVFMVVRHHQIEFASGALVFPGGKVDREDAGADWDSLTAPSPSDLDRAFAIAALRETFEEAGILIARERGASALLSAALTRRIVAAHRASGPRAHFVDVIRGAKLELATDLLVRFAHWITPVGLPKRYDTHFFIVAAPVDQTGAHDGLESVEGYWVRPAVALQEAKEGKRSIVPVTRLNLLRLARTATVMDAVAQARASRIVTVVPRIERHRDGGRTLQIPIEAGYGVSEVHLAAGELAIPAR
jgi:8-oxo-dGTP pyrophosphatase MutT (NUDIX family)